MTDMPPEDDTPQDSSQVGYGKPPLHSRFKPGQSGNPRGRPKGKRNMGNILSDVLGQTVTVTINGKRRKIRSDTAILLRLREKALGGDIRAMNALLALRVQHMPDSEGEGHSTDWAEEDRAILESFGLLKCKGAGDDQL